MDSNLGLKLKGLQGFMGGSDDEGEESGFCDDWVVWVWDCVSNLSIYGKKKKKKNFIRLF